MRPELPFQRSAILSFSSNRWKGAFPILFFLFFFPFKNSIAQTRTIINTEKSAPAPDQGLHGSINATGSFARGNIDLIDINGDGMIGHRRPNYWLRFLGGSTYYVQDGVKALDNNYLQLRYSRFFGEKKRWQSYQFAQFQTNHALILNQRGIAGAGIRKSFPFRDTGRIDLGGGIMYEYEKLDQAHLEEHESVYHRNWRFTSVLVFRRALNDQVSVLNTAYFQPRVDRLGDIRALNELSLLTQLTKKFQFDVTFYWRTDTDPPKAIVPSDLGVDFGVLLEL